MPISRIETNSIAPSQTLTTPIIATTMGVGGATPAGSGSGITFPAAQSASSDVNTLDDYEEGTFTPSLRFSGNSSGMTYSTQVGKYTKIGRLVYFVFRIALTAKGSSTGSAQVFGLPFPLANNDQADYAGATLGYGNSTSGFNVTLMLTLDRNNSYVYMRYNNGTSSTDLTQANFTDTTDLIINGCYHAAF